jgi:hypothetical protein
VAGFKTAVAGIEQNDSYDVIELGDNGVLRTAQMRNRDMCEKCKPIDDRIARYRRLGAQISDAQTLNGIARLIAELEVQKRALHPEQEK